MAIRGAAERETLTVARHEGRWAVEHMGVFSDHTGEKEEAKAEQERGAKRIEAAADAAVKELADRSAAMAVGLAEKIVRAKLTPSDHAELIERAVSGFVEWKSNGRKGKDER